MEGKHKCPVCGKYEFESSNSYEICEVCGWEDDGLQLRHPDLAGGANEMSLNQAKKAYAERIKKKERVNAKPDAAVRVAIA